MRYEWDPRKDRLNQRKHGVSFELASLVFEDERRLTRLDHVDATGEQRWIAIGAASPRPGMKAVLLVAHVYRRPFGQVRSPEAPWEDCYGEEVIRIISARPASKDDIRRYQEQEMD